MLIINALRVSCQTLTTAALAILIGVFQRRREQLEQLVTDRTRELRESEQSYRNQFANNSSVMLLIDPKDGSIIDANGAAVSFYGYSREKMLAMRITDVNTLPPDEILQIVSSVLTKQAQRFQFQHRLANGEVRDVEASISRIEFGGRVVFHSIIFDVTKRKQVEAALQQAARANELLRQCILAVNASLDFDSAMGCLLQKVIGLDSLDGGVLYLIEGQDAVLRHQVGLEPEFVAQVARRPLSTGYMKAALENPHEIINVMERFPEQNQLGQAYGLRHVHCIALMAGQQPLGFLNVFSRRVEPPSTADIEFIRILALEAGSVFLHFRIEDRLLHLNAEMRVILDTTPLGVSYIKDRKVQWVNPAFAHILGYTVEESVGLDSAAFYVSREEYERAGRGAYEQISKGESYSFEVRFKRKDGSLFWADLVGKCVNPTNLAAGSIWTLHDTTERKGMLEAIQESELRLRSILMAMTEGVIVRTAEGTVIDCNLNAEKILGMSRNEIMGLTSIPPSLASRASRRFHLPKRRPPGVGQPAHGPGLPRYADGISFAGGIEKMDQHQR